MYVTHGEFSENTWNLISLECGHPDLGFEVKEIFQKSEGNFSEKSIRRIVKKIITMFSASHACSTLMFREAQIKKLAKPSTDNS